MKEFKGTPGPWHIRSRLAGSVGTDNQLVHICMNTIRPDLGMGEEDNYNTHLIAAAPDLLEALECALHHVREQAKHDGLAFGHFQLCQKAIAKALGEKQ